MKLSWLRHALCQVCGLLIVALLGAQGDLEVTTISMEEGLSHRAVSLVTRDSRGFLWIVTSDIDFYDGQSIKAYNKFDSLRYIPTSGIRSAGSLNDSLVVFSDGVQLYALELNTGEVREWSFPEPIGTMLTWANGIVTRQHHNNTVVFSTSANKERVTLLSKDWEFLCQFEVDQSDQLRLELQRSYACTDGGTLWILDQYRERLVRVTSMGTSYIRFPFPKIPGADHFKIIGQPGFGLLIVRDNGEVYCVRNGENEIEFLRNVSLDGSELKAFHVSSNNVIWLICVDRIIKFSTSNDFESVFLVQPFGQYTPHVHNTYEDDEGIVWISTELGLIKIQDNGSPFRTLLKQPDDSVNLQFRDIIGSGCDTVFARIHVQDRKLIRILMDSCSIEPLAFETLASVAGRGKYEKYRDYIYTVMGGTPDLIRMDSKTGISSTIKLPDAASDQFYNQFFINDEGVVIYQNASFGLSTYNLNDGSAGKLNLELPDVLMESPWRSIGAIGDSILFIATELEGLYLFDVQSGKLINNYNASSTPAITGNFVNAVEIDSDSSLWVGTLGAGLNHVDFRNNIVTSYTTGNGLANNMIASLTEDNAGHLWVGTYSGLSMFDPMVKTFSNYYERDGISDNEFNYMATHKGSNGNLFIGSFNGLTIFDPTEVIGRDTLPPVQLVGVRKFNRRKNQRFEQVIYGNRDNRFEVLPYDNYIEFEFAVPSYRSNSPYTFYSRLIGSDADWQELGPTNLLRYQKLPPGNHTLQLMAVDASGNETSAPTSIELFVKQAFYKSIWFIVLIAAGLIGFVVLLARYRIYLLRKEYAVRTRIASDLHDEVGSALTGLSLQVQMLELGATGEVKGKLTAISNRINSMVSKMRDLVWSVDGRSDTWEKVLERMYDYASETLFASGIQYTFDVRGVDTDQKLAPRLKHNLYLIFKEAVHNISRHSQAQNATIAIHVKGKDLVMVVRDNGSGAGHGGSVKGQGLQNMQMRAKRLGGKLCSGKIDGSGFEVVLKCAI